jgi:hypothetical protein
MKKYEHKDISEFIHAGSGQGLKTRDRPDQRTGYYE